MTAPWQEETSRFPSCSPSKWTLPQSDDSTTQTMPPFLKWRHRFWMKRSRVQSLIKSVMTLRTVLSLVSGFLLLLAFPSFKYHWLAWVALTPLLFILTSSSWQQGAWLGFVTQTTFLMGIFWWMNTLSGYHWSDFSLMALYVGVYGALFGGGYSRLRLSLNLPATFLAPSLWVALEYVRANAGFLSLPWALIGHSQYEQIPLIQIASITGVYGISFLIVMVNGLIVDLCTQTPWITGLLGERRYAITISMTSLGLSLIGTFALLTSSLLYGWFTLDRQQDQTNQISLTVIQGNIRQDHKWDPERLMQNLEQHIRLTR